MGNKTYAVVDKTNHRVYLAGDATNAVLVLKRVMNQVATVYENRYLPYNDYSRDYCYTYRVEMTQDTMYTGKVTMDETCWMYDRGEPEVHTKTVASTSFEIMEVFNYE